MEGTILTLSRYMLLKIQKKEQEGVFL